MTRRDAGSRPAHGPVPVVGTHLGVPAGRPATPAGHGRHAAAGTSGPAGDGGLDDDSWQWEEIERDRRRERRLVWQSLVAFVVVAALVVLGRAVG